MSIRDILFPADGDLSRIYVFDRYRERAAKTTGNVVRALGGRALREYQQVFDNQLAQPGNNIVDARGAFPMQPGALAPNISLPEQPSHVRIIE